MLDKNPANENATFRPHCERQDSTHLPKVYWSKLVFCFCSKVSDNNQGYLHSSAFVFLFQRSDDLSAKPRGIKCIKNLHMQPTPQTETVITNHSALSLVLASTICPTENVAAAIEEKAKNSSAQ